MKNVKDYPWRLTNLTLAIEVSNKILEDDFFYEKIASKDKGFDIRYTGKLVTPEKIAEWARECDEVMKVKTYNYGWRNRFAPALAKVIAGMPNSIFFNSGKLNRPTSTIVATTIHEDFHLLERWVRKNKFPELSDTDFKELWGFHHGDNSPAGKENTVQYWVDDLAESIAADMLGEEKPENEPRFRRRPWWRRLKTFVWNVIF